MAWLPTYDQGRTPGEIAAAAGMSVQGRNPIPQRNQWAEAIAKIAPALMAALKQKRNDEIANQIMNQWAPPRAEAVDPSLQGAPASDPFEGGAEGFEAQQLYQKMLRQDEDQSLQRRVTEARVNNLERPRARVMGRETDGNKAMTAYQQQELLRLREKDIDRKADRYGKKPGPHELVPAPEVYPDTQSADTPTGGATPNPQKVLDEARAAIKKGKDPEAVKKRLAEMGIDSTLL